jgi:hypothetical protein
MSSFPREIRVAATLFGALVVSGVVLGLIWAWWSPAGPQGYQYTHHIALQLSEESETFAASDGRFAVLTVSLGVLAGIAMWFVRSVRGPWIVLALGVGGWLSAEVTSLVGHLAGGGSDSGVYQHTIAHLGLHVRASGLIMIEGAAAVLLYSVLSAFAADDDLGRPDPVRDALQLPALELAGVGAGGSVAGPGSVAAGSGAEHPSGQHPGFDGDASRLPQQYGLPPEDRGDTP